MNRVAKQKQPAPSPEAAARLKEEERAMNRTDAVAAASFAHDYVEIRPGVRLYRVKVAHKWAMNYIQSDPRYAERLKNATEATVAMSYLLSHGQDTTRNQLIKDARKGTFLDDAWDWIDRIEIEPGELQDAVRDLMPEITANEESDAPDGEPEAGE